MNQRLALSTIVVKDYDLAIDFYVNKLGFILVEDTKLDDNGKRWVVVSPTGGDAALLLAQASGEQQLAAIGNQAGGRVAFFLNTDDFRRDYESYQSKGVKFVREPEVHEYGTVAVFQDVCGNLWDLIERKAD